MRTRCRLAFLILAVGVCGCVGDGSGDPFAFRNPFKSEPEFDPIKAPQAATRTATRVVAVGNEVVGKNTPGLGFKPVFFTSGVRDLEVFHKGTSMVVLSEGLVDRCQTDAELAAVICHELGKMAAENGDRKPSRADMDPASARGPADVVGAGHTADMTGVAADAMLNRPNPRRNRGGRDAEPDARTLAQDFLVRAGHTADDLERVQPLVREAEDNVQKRESPWRR
jgi:hypothetical protein